MTIVDSPVIAISYHTRDGYWSESLQAELSKLAGFSVHPAPVDDSTGKIEDGLLSALTNANVLVVLLSPSYLKSTLFATEPDYKELLGKKAFDVYALKAQEISREQLLALPRGCFPFNSTPLAVATPEMAQFILGHSVTSITSRLQRGAFTPGRALTIESPTIADLSRLPRSNEVEIALRRARKLATLGPISPAAVTTPALLFGLAEGGRTIEANVFHTPQFLWFDLTSQNQHAYTEALLSEFPGLIRLGERSGRNIDSLSAETDRVSPNVVGVFELAEAIAHRTVRYDSRRSSAAQQFVVADGPQLSARHLLAALLFTADEGVNGASRRLAALTDVPALRRRFYNFIVENVPLDDHEAWESILIDLKLPEIQKKQDGAAAKPRESTRQPSVAGFMADEWDGSDLLGITRDVEALASLVAAYKVEPPLSIGLFGDWGSGKSHFMRQMRKRVEMLSRLARESNEPQNKLGYYKNIVQIEFNAWHYIEGNLWASLVDHIFANLRLSEREPPKYAEQRRDELMQKLGLKEELKKRIDSQVEECEAELRKVEERKQHAEAELNRASTQLEAFRHQSVASLETLTVAVDLTQEEKELLGRLGIKTDGVINGAKVRKNYDELKGVRNRIKAQWKLFRSDKRVGWRILLSALVVIVVVGGPLLLKLVPFFSIPTIVLTVLGFITSFIAAAKPVWRQFQKSLKALEKQDQEIERQRSQRITELQSKVDFLTGQVVTAKLQSETVGKEIEELKADITTTSSSKLLAEFIEDRAAANDYRRHLGLLALIRRDFEKLRDLFNQQRKEEIAGTEPRNENKINRIILYIDDLDRCPPERVVQVLQAIHLLLAFPLFVVVVGVDSRWITRSLQQRYEWLREAEELTWNNEGQQGNQNKNHQRGIGATPHDYLEKIFQIPFWLRSMTNEACLRYLDGLTENATSDHGSAPALEWESQVVSLEPQTLTETVGAVASSVSPAGLHVPAGNPQQSVPTELHQTGSRSIPANLEKTDGKIDLAPDSLSLTSYEIEFMKKLVPLIGRSPRAVKRFLNCYRLIKVGLTPADFKTFVGENGESNCFKATMFLLAVITGVPTVSSYVIDQLNPLRKPRPTDIETLFDALAADTEFQQQPDAERLMAYLKYHDFGIETVSLFNEIVKCQTTVSRFSFRVRAAGTSR